MTAYENAQRKRAMILTDLDRMVAMCRGARTVTISPQIEEFVSRAEIKARTGLEVIIAGEYVTPGGDTAYIGGAPDWC